MDFTTILLIIINFAGSLAVFLFAMKMMSEGLQKVAGSKMRAVLGRMTGKLLNGILTLQSKSTELWECEKTRQCYYQGR